MSQNKSNSRNWYLTGFACLITAIATYAVSDYCHKKGSARSETHEKLNRSHVKALRIQDYRFTKPLLMADLDTEDEDMSEIKNEALSIIMQAKSSGNLHDAAVFMQDLQNGDWFSINPDGTFDPGSIMKLPILIAHLKQEEMSPGHLMKQYRLSTPMSGMPVQTILGESIQIGKAYTVAELLRYMIVESDNQANALLNQIVNPKLVQQIFMDLGLSVPSVQQTQVQMKIADVSKFIGLLYNATYLRNDLSEFALELLSETKFHDGIRAIAPAGIPICSKFGERGQLGTDIFEIHETSIVYIENRPFLLTMMTRGNDKDKQETVLQSVSASAIKFIKVSVAS